jgi:hypothetical protein
MARSASRPVTPEQFNWRRPGRSGAFVVDRGGNGQRGGNLTTSRVVVAPPPQKDRGAMLGLNNPRRGVSLVRRLDT